MKTLLKPMCTQAAMMPHPEGLRVTPEMARQQMDALKRVQPDQLENLAAMAEGGGPPDAQRAAEMLKASSHTNPQRAYNCACRVSNHKSKGYTCRACAAEALGRQQAPRQRFDKSTVPHICRGPAWTVHACAHMRRRLMTKRSQHVRMHGRPITMSLMRSWHVPAAGESGPPEAIHRGDVVHASGALLMRSARNHRFFFIIAACRAATLCR